MRCKVHLRIEFGRRGAAAILLSLVSAGLLLLSAPQAALAGSQGGLYRDNNANGVRASLTGDSNLGGTNASIIATVRVQNSISGGFGMYQAGWLKQGSNSSTDCLNGSFTGAMVERQSQSTGIYICNPYSGIGSYGDLYLFRIKHVPAGWEAIKANGNILDGPYDLGFPGGYSMAVSEKNNSITSASMTFGPSGATAWGRYDTTTDTWYQINTATPFPPGGDGWSIGNPPSPFNISR